MINYISSCFSITMINFLESFVNWIFYKKYPIKTCDQVTDHWNYNSVEFNEWMNEWVNE